MSDDDLKQHVNSPHDFYALLDVSPTAAEADLRRAYRKTALKYHPDKVGAADTAAIEKFHLLSIAYNVLSDHTVRELYDNARRAKEQTKLRETQMSAERRTMLDDLNRREKEHMKRKYGVMDEAEKEEEMEKAREREEVKRQKMEFAERRRREQEAEWKILYEDEIPEEPSVVKSANGTEVKDEDRAIKFHFPGDAKIDNEHIIRLFSKFGSIQDVIIRPKQAKKSIKQRRAYNMVMLVFDNISSARAAVAAFPELAETEPREYGMFEDVKWFTGGEPAVKPAVKPAPVSSAKPRPAAVMDDAMMARLRDADKRRLEKAKAKEANEE